MVQLKITRCNDFFNLFDDFIKTLQEYLNNTNCKILIDVIDAERNSRKENISNNTELSLSYSTNKVDLINDSYLSITPYFSHFKNKSNFESSTFLFIPLTEIRSLKKIDYKRVVFVFDFTSPCVLFVLEPLIKIFNTKADFNLSILDNNLSKEIKQIILKKCNNKEKLKFIKNNELSIHDVIISSDTIALNFYYNKFRTIVLGENGFGGLIKGENLSLFIKSGFLGRIGGYLYEEVNYKLVEYEIDLAFSYDVSIEKSEIKKLITLLNKEVLNKIKNDSLFINPNDIEKIVELKPIVKQNVKYRFFSQNVYIISYLEYTPILFNISDFALLKSFNGKSTIKEIAQAHSYDIRDILTTIKLLYTSLIIELR